MLPNITKPRNDAILLKSTMTPCGDVCRLVSIDYVYYTNYCIVN